MRFEGLTPMHFRVLLVSACCLTAATCAVADRPVATSRIIGSLESHASEQFTAVAAFRIYQHFERANSIPSGLKDRFDSKYGQWKQRSADNLVRMGRKWVTPKERQEVASETAVLVEAGFSAIRAKNGKRAEQNLLDASRHDRGAILADYVLGVMYSGEWSDVSVSNPESAIKYFENAVDRMPEHVGALNNLAVSLIKNGEDSQAIRHWEKAVSLSPDNHAVRHNVERLLIENSRGALESRPSVLKRARRIFSEKSYSPQANESDRVWAIMPVVVPDRERLPKYEAKGNQSLTYTGSASGVVISPGHVLASLDLIRNQLYGRFDRLLVSNPQTSDRAVAATVIAESPELDLALLSCPGLKAPALDLSLEVPETDTEVMAANRYSVDDNHLDATQGQILNVPESSYEYFQHSAVGDERCAGSPVVSADGTIVAFNLASLPVGRRVGIAVPSALIIEFVSPFLSGVTGVPAGKEMDWSDVADKLAESVVALQAEFVDAAAILVQADGARVQFDYLVDPSCAHCKGLGKVGCPDRKCRGGGILKYRTFTEILAKSDLGTVTKNRKKSFRSRCPTCGGDGAVNCEFCSGSGRAR